MNELTAKIVATGVFAVIFIALEKTFGIALALFFLVVIGLALCLILDIVLLLLTAGSRKCSGFLALLLGVMLGNSLRNDD